MCPECEEPVVGVKEQEDLDAESIEVEDLILFNKAICQVSRSKVGEKLTLLRWSVKLG